MVEIKMLISRLYFVLNLILLFAVSWILFIALGVSVNHFSWIIIFFLGLFLILVRFIYKKIDMNDNDGVLQKIFFILSVLSFIICLIIAYSLEVDVYDTWDYGQLIRTVYEDIVHGDFINAEYYARYPNNSMFLLILSFYFQLLNSTHLCSDNIYSYLDALIPLNCILIVLSIIFTYLSAKTFFSTKTAFKCGLILLGMSPLYLYATITYTDVFAIFPLSLSVYFYSQFKSSHLLCKKAFWLILTAVVLGIGYKIKATLIILFVAVLIDLFFMLNKKAIRHLLYIFLFLAIFFIITICCSSISDDYLQQNGVSDSMREQQEFPVTHWIMMGLNPVYDGGYNQDDVDFTMSFEGKKEKEEANISQINNRVDEMGVWGTLNHVFIKKVIRMWGSGDCNASDYVSRQPLRENLLRDIFSLNGNYNYCYRFVSQIYYLFLIISVFALAVWNVIERSDIPKKTFMIELSILGIFLFFLIWECNSRYLFVFLPLFALTTASGSHIWKKTYRNSGK